MPKIHFTHSYPKLNGPDGLPVIRAKLLEVIQIELGDMSAEFLNYDTNNGQFPLPSYGDYLMLIFRKSSSQDATANIFTTLRANREGKEKYYRGLIGAMFLVEVHGE